MLQEERILINRFWKISLIFLKLLTEKMSTPADHHRKSMQANLKLYVKYISLEANREEAGVFKSYGWISSARM